MADGPLFIVDNGASGRNGLDYLREWSELASSIDIATGFFEIGSLLDLDGHWQKFDKISRTHLTRLCEEGRIESFTVGNALRIPADEVMRILHERGRVKTQAREAAATADDRRRARAARVAGLL